MSPISDQLGNEFEEVAAKGTFADLFELSEKLSLETDASLVFGVKAGSFDTKGQTKFCEKVLGLFVHDWVDSLYVAAYQIPWIQYLMLRFRVPLNKPIHYIKETLWNVLEYKKDPMNRRNDIIDFMSSALSQKEAKIGSQGPDSMRYCDMAGLSGEEFIMANSLQLFMAAHDTTCLFLSYLFYELALNPDIQRNLQASFLILWSHQETEQNAVTDF